MWSSLIPLKRHGAYISAMLSGRLAGMAVSPFPLQSTMLLLHVHMAGQEPPPTLHVCRPEDSWWPGKNKEKQANIRREMPNSYRCVSAA